MTIKQQGGIFGRNPTFNDLTVENNLTVDGTTTHNGTQNITGQLNVDNVRIDGNTVSATDTNGDLFLSASGSGDVKTVIGSSGTAYYIENSGGGYVQIDGSPYGSQYWTNDAPAAIRFQDKGNYSSDIEFRVKAASASGLQTTVASITNAGDVWTSGNYRVGTSGKGIDFSATSGTGTSELFDDYEEGLHTPTITPQTSGTLTFNTANDSMYYAKIGRQVFVGGSLRINVSSSPVGTYVDITLPFTVAALTDSAAFSTTFIDVLGSPTLTLTQPSTSVMRVYVDASTLVGGTYINFSINYPAA